MDPEEATAPELDTTVSQPTEQIPASEDTSGGNPAWAPLREKLDPISFHKIEEDLKAFDTAAQQRVQSVNERFKPWQGFADEQIRPEQIQQWRSIAQQIEEAPEVVYNFLGQYLQQTGRMPSAQEVEAEVDASQEAEEQTPEASQSEDPRVAQLQQQLESVQEYIQQQAEAAEQAQLDEAVNTEITTFKQAHPDLSDEDMKEVLMRTALITQERGDMASLDEGFASLSAYRDRILNTPRPRDLAPTLIPTSGGVPAAPAAAQRSLGQLSNQEVQNLVAGLISQNNGNR